MSSQKENQNEKDQARQHLLSITLKALRDESYKEQLLANPTKAIQELYPEFKTDAKIVIQDQTTPDTLYLNVSPSEAALLYEGIEDLELSEEDLEMVAGGVLEIEGDNTGCTNNGCGNNGWQCWFS